MTNMHNIIQSLSELDEDGLDEFDRSFLESVVERTGNGKAPGVLAEVELTRLERMYDRLCLTSS